MKICDLCSKETDELITLANEYRLLETSEVCEECFEKIKNLIAELRRTYDEIFVKEKFNLVERLYRKLKGQK